MFTTLAMFLTISSTPIATPVADATPVDVALVLAVDMSGSMDVEEAQVQRLGYVEALRHPDFINAVTAGLNGRIAVSYFEWAGSVNETSVIKWQLIDDAQDAAILAEHLATRPVFTRRGTSISNALAFASKLIAASPYDAMRRVVDVSGDGPNNLGPPVDPVRNAAVASGIIINGLAILIRPPAVAFRLTGTMLIALSAAPALSFCRFTSRKISLSPSGRNWSWRSAVRGRQRGLCPHKSPLPPIA